MADSKVSRQVRKAHQDAAGLEQAAKSRAPARREMSKGSCGAHARPPEASTAVASERHRRCQDRNKPVLDIFAWSSRVSRAIRRAGFPTKEWEILHGAQYDLTFPPVLRSVCREIRDGVTACMLGPPCFSFSRARDRTRVIRTRAFPWGIRSGYLSENDKKVLLVGSACLRSALRTCLSRDQDTFHIREPADFQDAFSSGGCSNNGT